MWAADQRRLALLPAHNRDATLFAAGFSSVSQRRVTGRQQVRSLRHLDDLT